MFLYICRWHVLGKKKPPTFVGGSMFALLIFLGRPTHCPAVRKCPVDTCRQKKPRLFSRGFVFALPIFPGSHPPSIVGVHVLNFCVRDGNRWTHMTINTNSYGSVLADHFMSNSLSCLTFVVTHTGFEPMLTA